MFGSTRSTTYGLMYFLVAFSVIGGTVASQQYFILQSEEKTMLVRRTLDESFIVTMKRMGGEESNPEMAKELAHQKTILEGSYSSAAAIVAQLKIRALTETIAWCVVFVISSWTLIVNHRKLPTSGVLPTSSSE